MALCDVNEANLDAAAGRFPKARKFVDFRKMFDRPQEFDAVTVATCEHTHAMPTMLALKHKKHVYCEKPLTHDVWEARQIRLAAAEAGVATQMGIQIHAGENYRQVVELIQTGAITPSGSRRARRVPRAALTSSIPAGSPKRTTWAT